MIYTVFYGKTQIGVLEINDRGQHRYTPDVIGTETVKTSISLFHELLEKSDWRDPILLFKNRIDDASRFSQEDYISNQTDNFVLVKKTIPHEKPLSYW